MGSIYAIKTEIVKQQRSLGKKGEENATVFLLKSIHYFHLPRRRVTLIKTLKVPFGLIYSELMVRTNIVRWAGYRPE